MVTTFCENGSDLAELATREQPEGECIDELKTMPAPRRVLRNHDVCWYLSYLANAAGGAIVDYKHQLFMVNNLHCYSCL
jgi:hypothetical protein